MIGRVVCWRCAKIVTLAPLVGLLVGAGLAWAAVVGLQVAVASEAAVALATAEDEADTEVDTEGDTAGPLLRVSITALPLPLPHHLIHLRITQRLGGKEARFVNNAICGFSYG